MTDGALRDSPAFADLAMPSYCCAAHAATSTLMHFAVDMNVPIGCAGVLVMPGDVLAGDAEGVVAIPAAIANEVALDALEQEMAEASALERVREWESIVDLYPLAESRRSEYVEWLARRSGAVAE